MHTRYAYWSRRSWARRPSEIQRNPLALSAILRDKDVRDGQIGSHDVGFVGEAYFFRYVARYNNHTDLLTYASRCGIGIACSEHHV